MCRFSLYLNTEKRLHHKRNDTDTIQELSPISKRIASNWYLFCLHWRETGKVFDTVLFRVLPGMDDKRTLLWYQKTLGKNIIYINNIWIYNICIFIIWINYIEIFFYWIFVCIFAVWSYKYGSSSFKSGNFFRWYWL